MASPMQVLFIEDSVEDIGHTVGYLEREAPDISLTVANSLAEAKSKLSTQNFDSVIIDYDPPDGSGIEFLAYLREIGNSAVPILITEYANYGMLNDIFRQGMFYQVTKADCYWECLPILLEQAVHFSRALAEERAANQATPANLAEKRDQLMSRLSHEVKTPLTSILGFAHMLVTKPDAPVEKRQKWANFIHSKSQQLGRLIDNMLDLSDMQTGQLTVDKRPTNLSTLIDDAVAEIEGIAPTRVIEATVPAELPELDIDADRVEQVIVNLLTNAHNLTPEGQSIELEVRDRSDAVEVAVIDHGPTVPPETRENVFEPFSAEPGSGHQPGKGLWLPLARSIIEAHGGRLWLESAPPQGSIFIFSLPKE
jgi:signal transduction histidine kinase